jgi:hypothetical protein
MLLRFTLFNCITFFVLVLTVLLVWRRFAGMPLSANWPLAYYAAVIAYTKAFGGGLNPYWVAAAVACGLAIRLGLYAARVRLVEVIPLGYVAYRCVGLILMW